MSQSVPAGPAACGSNRVSSGGAHMFAKAIGRITGSCKAREEKVPPAEPPQAAPGGLAQMINSAGRVQLGMLQRLAQALPREEFVRFVQAPALAGAAIHLGTLASPSASGPREMNRTVLFEPVEDAEEPAAASDSLKHAVYPLVKSDFATNTSAVFSVGRIDGNDLIMPDYAISKSQAVLELRRGTYLIRDCGSTNGTLLNGERVEQKPLELKDRDVLSFARYEFVFLFAGTLFDTLNRDVGRHPAGRPAAASKDPAPSAGS